MRVRTSPFTVMT